MTDNVKYSTSYFHEAISHAFEMFKNGYEPVMETPFQPRRLGSAFVTEYKLVRESLDEAHQLTIQQKWEAEEALNELAQQSQELGMYEVDKEQVKVYSKSELEAMEWSEFKKLIDAAGIRGRRRANLTRDYLIYQEESLK